MQPLIACLPYPLLNLGQRFVSAYLSKLDQAVLTMLVRCLVKIESANHLYLCLLAVIDASDGVATVPLLQWSE